MVGFMLETFLRLYISFDDKSQRMDVCNQTSFFVLLLLQFILLQILHIGVILKNFVTTERILNQYLSNIIMGRVDNQLLSTYNLGEPTYILGLGIKCKNLSKIFVVG